MLAVCNSLAENRASEKSDIDLFIIVKNGRLGSARFFMKLLTQICGARVHHNKKAGRFCLSFFVTERAMDLSCSVYGADMSFGNFVRGITPISGEKTYLKFIEENSGWIKGFEPRISHIREGFFTRVLRRIIEILFWPFAWLFESLFFRLQYKKDARRAERFKKTGGIILTKDVFKFHEDEIASRSLP